ncbi:hypothetical protein W03_06560 [Nitrosomonas sp. PY1]|uniref:EndoU domain-containing protein n=1 Tax=Nitrosomonas sp. PY1 TaxID=1803906 RepID=UPI001FC8285F|nr:EndoU domain-containing protein [Nitrosomonas sp. PY1]GKS68652.1 hypothetical protein W03_06560 [Nitrosomonas sp. PY1]
MNKHRIKCASRIILHLLVLTPLSLFAQINCDALPNTVSPQENPFINQQHIFCGEWHRDRPKGFHSRPDGKNPTSIAWLSIQSKPNKAGIYTVRWSHVRNPKKEKFSSMFPDQCTKQQVLNSIRYAARHTVRCPSNSPNWLQCGQNKPSITTEKENPQFCNYNNNLFTIGVAFDDNNKVNTAFPIFE